MRLLLLEDDRTLGEGLRDYLREDGHVVDWCQTLSQARTLQSEPYDALLVDWQLPDGSGMDWIRAMRARGEMRPILMLTARDRLSDRVQGLDAGADDYLVKPFDPEELAARLRAVTRRAAGTASAMLRFGEVSVDLAAKRAFLHDIPTELTAREWAVLEALVTRAGRYVSKADLEALVSGSESETTSNILEVHVHNIRRKLGRELIQTGRGLGYRVPK